MYKIKKTSNYQATNYSMRLFLLIFFSALTTVGSAQTINTATVNAGGGNYAHAYYQIDWSIGESASIETFKSTDGAFLLTTGVLQPFTEKSTFTSFLNYTWAKDEIAIFPVPTRNTLEVDIKIAATGDMTMSLYDQLGRAVLTRRFDYFRTNNIQKFDLSGLVSGVYFLEVTLGTKPVFTVIRKGTFKIQKL